MKVTRRTFAAVAASAAFGMQRWPAGAAEFNYKFGGDQAMQHPMTLRSREAAERINQEAGGRLAVEFFPNSTLGASVDLLKQVRLGAIQFTVIGDNIVQTVVPAVGISAIPFAFASYKDAWAAMDGPLGSYARAQIAKTGLFAFGKSWDSGLRQVMNGVRPLNTPADFRGLKIRVPVAPLNLAMFRALGASPTPVDGSQVYLGLQTHLIDGAESGIAFFQVQKIYEVQKYLSITNHQWTGYTMLANGDAWQKLPASLREIVERNFDRYALLDRTDDRTGDDELIATLSREGIAVNKADLPSLKGAIARQGLYAQWRDQFGADAWGMLERSVGKLT